MPKAGHGGCEKNKLVWSKSEKLAFYIYTVCDKLVENKKEEAFGGFDKSSLTAPLWKGVS